MTPSEDDQDFTDHFIQAGKFLKVEVTDHLIISDENYHSFVDSGIFKKLQESKRWIMPYLLEEKARQEGEKIGEEKGSKAKAIEIAKALKQKEINITIIAETAGLSIEEVKTL